MSGNDKTFIRVTNKDIYNKQIKHDEKLANIEKHVIKTNGSVAVNKWISRTALTLVILLIGWRVLG